ncbi:Zinc knuckle CX2CX4HX4C [Sesbania bispinosa]|nr:Zinc knuckle CX2CX4HX4C [Sesbania bispinosa]
MGNLLSFQFWVPKAAIYEVNFDRISFWIQVYGLPLDAMSISNAARIIQRFGEVLEVENPEVEGKLLRTYFRVRAMINVKNQLVTGCCVPRKSLPKVWIMLKYERLQSLCYQCGIIGHDQKMCKSVLATSPLDPSIPKYSSKLGVPPAKPIPQLLKEQGNWKSNNHNGPGTSKGQSTTRIDLQEGKTRPEFYGPTKEKVLQDYPSPSERRYQGAEIGSQDVIRCREIILKSKKGKAHQEENNESHTHTPYIVQFPEEEDKGDDCSTKTNMQDKEETDLIVGWNRALSLKRNRENMMSFTEGIVNTELRGKIHKKGPYLQWETGVVMEGTLAQIHDMLLGKGKCTMAEEAGQNFPHPQP